MYGFPEMSPSQALYQKPLKVAIGSVPSCRPRGSLRPLGSRTLAAIRQVAGPLLAKLQTLVVHTLPCLLDQTYPLLAGQCK